MHKKTRPQFHLKLTTPTILFCLSLVLILPSLVFIFFYQKAAPPNSFAFFSKQVTSLVKKKDPKAALDYIEKEMVNNSEMMKYCHPLVHLVGHVAYEKYGDFVKAIEYQNDICGSGYFHGVIEEKLSHSSDATQEMQTICNNVSQDNEADCYHGVGHGLMYYTENDLPKSISLCQKYENSNHLTRCAEGVYMENFSTTKESLHSSRFLKEDDTFFPCAEQPENVKNVCYFYSSIYYLSLNPGQYSKGLTHCLTAEKKYQYACAKGIGSRLMKENLTSTAANEAVCDQADPSLRIPCIEGLTSYHLINYDSIAKTQSMCEQLHENNKTVCLNYVSVRSMNFGE